MWGPLIIHNQPEVYAKDYDRELTITLSDWYHTSGQVNIDWFLSPASDGNEPIPFSVLMNGRGAYPCQNTTLPCDPTKQIPQVFRVESGKRYRIRVINTSAITTFIFSIPGHKLVTIETDGVDTVKVPLDRVPIFAAQRYSFIVEMNCDLAEKWIVAEVDLGMFGLDEPNINPNPESLIPVVRAKLEYIYPWFPTPGVVKHKRCPVRPPGDDPEFQKEMLLQPYDKILAPVKFDQEIVLVVDQLIDSRGKYLHMPVFQHFFKGFSLCICLKLSFFCYCRGKPIDF